jgi:glycosyltransferase 2 family protein
MRGRRPTYMAEGKARRTGGLVAADPEPQDGPREPGLGTPPGDQRQAGQQAPAADAPAAASPAPAAADPAPAAGDPVPAAGDPVPAEDPVPSAEDPALAAADLVLAADPALAAADPAQAAAAAAAGGGSPFARRLAQLVRIMRSKTVRFGFLAAVLVLLGLALTDEAGTLWHEVQQLSAPVVALAFVLNLGGLFCSMMVWRELLADLGSRLSVTEAWRIMFIGQLGKYVPGSIWPVLAQAELGADRAIPRSRSALSVLLSYGVMTCSGAVVAAVTLPFATAASAEQYFWILFLLPVAIVALSPPVLNKMLRLVLRLSRQPALEQGVSYKGLARTMVWALAGWTLNGLMVYVLMRQLAGDAQGTLLVSVGAYALSWAAGFLAVFAPAGTGVREAVMVAVLHMRTTTAIALVIALVTRALAVLCDALTGAAAAALVGRGRLRRLRDTSGPPAPPPAGG